MRCRVYVTVGCPSVRPSVCPLDSSHLSIHAADARAQQERAASALRTEEENRDRLVSFYTDFVVDMSSQEDRRTGRRVEDDWQQYEVA